jgi:integrase
MPLTDKACKNALPGAKPYKKADSHGLFLRVMPNGARYWRLKYRFMGKEKMLALGVYPETTLAEAREKRDAARKLLADNKDPSLVKQQAKHLAAISAETTFEAVAREWHETQKEKWSTNYAKDLLHRLDKDIFPALGTAAISTITTPQLLSVMRGIEKRGAREIAHRAVQVCGQIFRYAITTGKAERNPAADLRGALQPVRHTHFAALDSKEIPAFLHALERNDARLYQHTRHAVKLLMLTFVRTSELINAKWDEFDFEAKQWNIPAERMKMRAPHIVPLSRQVIELLEEQKKLTGKWEWIFPNQVRPHKPMSNCTILKALERLGYKDRMTGHGFRALAMSTIKENLGYRHEVVDRQLAHAARNKVDAAYDRAQFLPERKKMMQQWADYLDAAASENKVIVAKFGK